MPQQLPQGLKALLGDIGESLALFRLGIKTLGTPWQVFKNLGGVGHDILLVNEETGKQIRIEVKARQHIYRHGSKEAKTVHFFLSRNEWANSDFLIAFFLDDHGLYIVPKEALKSRREGRQWAFSLYKPTMDKNPYRDAWWRLPLKEGQ